MIPIVTVPPTIEPLTLEEVKLHCRVDYDDDDQLLTSLISAARRRAENYMGRALITQTLQWAFDWSEVKADWIFLPTPNVQSVSSLQYYNSNEVLTTESDSTYRAVNTSDSQNKCFLELTSGSVWPSTSTRAFPFLLTYVCGFGADAASIPEDIKVGMLMEIGTWYENRENLSPTSLSEVRAGSRSLYNHWRWHWSV